MTRSFRIFLLVVLLLILGSLQWHLWLGDSSRRVLWQKQEKLSTMLQTQADLTERNRRLFAEVEDLKTGLGTIEALARLDLGMIGPNETFYQVIEDTQTRQITPDSPTAPQMPVNPTPQSSAVSHRGGSEAPTEPPLVTTQNPHAR